MYWRDPQGAQIQFLPDLLQSTLWKQWAALSTPVCAHWPSASYPAPWVLSSGSWITQAVVA